MHLFITGQCNLHCNYCFAEETKRQFLNSEMSLPVFKKIIEFAKNNCVETIGLLGGEPFLHPLLPKFLEILDKEQFVKTIIVYTNGLFDSSFYDILLSKKIVVSVNANSPAMLSEKYSKLLENLCELKKRNIYTGISINIPSSDYDYSYIFEILSLLNKNALRFSFATSNMEKEAISNPIDYFRKIHDYIMLFYKNCYEKDVIPITSCNSIPLCLLNYDDKRLILKLHKKGEKISDINVLSCFNRCNSPITILPDLTVIRCFTFPKKHVSLLNYKSLQEIENIFKQEIDSSKDSFINSNFQCNNCAFKQNDFCNLCFGYKYRK